MQCINMENTLIKLTLHDETKKRAHDSQIDRAKVNLKLSHGVKLPLKNRQNKDLYDKRLKVESIVYCTFFFDRHVVVVGSIFLLQAI